MNHEGQNEELKPKAILKETDLLELAHKILQNRRFILKVCGIAAVLGLVVAFSIPKQYTAKVMMAPEVADKSGLSGSMGALASMAGINLGSMTGEDAISPQLYPKIISSAPFLTGLFDVQVTTKEGKLTTTLYDYLDKHQKIPWWGYIFRIPGTLLDGVYNMFIEKDLASSSTKINAFRLTKEQTKMAKVINEAITAFVDKKNDVITLSVTMQDPLIAASVADTVREKLQDAIIEYRTNKARNDLVFAEKLYKESQTEYLKAQKAYADYQDKNMDVALLRYEIESDRLKAQKDLAFSIFNQVSQQLQMAKAKVQENTPAFAVIQPATVPLLGSNMGKSIILILFILLGGLGAVAWLLVKDSIAGWKKKLLL